VLPREQHVDEAELREVLDAHRIEDAVEVVALVLHHARVEALDRAVDRLAKGVEAGVADLAVARHDAAHPGHRQASLPALLHLAPDRLHRRVDEHGVRHLLGIRVARVLLHAEDDDAQQHPDLRGGEPGAVQVLHGVAHVGDQLAQPARAEGLDLARALEQARVAHPEDRPDHGATRVPITRCTRRMASAMTSSIARMRMPRALSPRPAAWFTTTASAAYARSSSRASAASGMPVMPTRSAPSRSRRSISAAVSRRGPCVAAYTPPSAAFSPHAAAASSSRRRSAGAYGSVKSMWVTGAPSSKKVLRRPLV